MVSVNTISFPSLETERLVLRTPAATDTGAMLSFLGDKRSVFYGGPLSQGDAWKKLSTFAGQWLLCGYGMFSVVSKDTGKMVGMAGPYHPVDFPEPEMSWLLTDPAHEGKGYATEACRAVLTYLFATLGWKNVVSYIDADNLASRTLALRLGATVDPNAISPIPNCDGYRHSSEDFV